MTNKKFLFGILAITLVFTMTVVGCGEDPADNNSGSGGGSSGKIQVYAPSANPIT